jgi:hypothetical protein
VLDRLGEMWVGEVLAHDVQGLALAALSLRRIDFLTARRYLAAAASEVPFGGDPIMVEGNIRVLNYCYSHGRAMTSNDDRLVGLESESPRGVQAGNTGPSAVVGLDERLAALDKLDVVDSSEEVDRVLRCGDDVGGRERFIGRCLGDESLVDRFERPGVPRDADSQRVRLGRPSCPTEGDC